MRELYQNFRWGFDGEPQCMAVEHGRVVFREPAGRHEFEGASLHDLSGKFLLPCFIDSHCHILPTGLDLQKLNLRGCEQKEDVLDRVRERNRELEDGGFLLAVQYDQTRFADGKHLSRHDLDGISNERPILLRHANGHASVANTAMLLAAGVDETVADPRGGVFVRDSSGLLTGVLLERAHEQVSNTLGAPSLDQMVGAILKAGDLMAAEGIGTASDLMTGRWDLELELEAYRLAAEQGCRVRTRLYLMWGSVFGPRALPRRRLEELEMALDPSRCQISGVKIFADGAIGSATASIYGRFVSSATDSGAYTDGQMIYETDRLRQMIHTAHEAGYRIAIHSIGDHSTDAVMDAYSELDAPERHRIEHAMILNDDQIVRMERLGIHCCMQPEFLHSFGHSYRRQLGEERAALLNRYQSVIEAGIPMSFSSDRPVVEGNPWTGILASESRPAGFDPGESITRAQAVYAYTAMGGIANGEADSNGFLLPGHFADFQLYEEDPMSGSPPFPVDSRDVSSPSLREGPGEDAASALV